MVGDKVLVTTNTSDTSTATAITLNPSFGGGARNGASSNPNTSPTPST